MRIRLYNIAATLVLIISLIMPIACDASRLLDLVDSAAVAHTRFEADAGHDHCPCPECPFSHHCESDCCSVYAPLFQGLELDYAPTSAGLNFISIDSKPPQVYFSIFVPPQNHVA